MLLGEREEEIPIDDALFPSRSNPDAPVHGGVRKAASFMKQDLGLLRQQLDSLAAAAASCAGPGAPDDGPALLACEEAWEAVRVGNYGVGAVLLAPSGQVVARGRNQVFHPQFHSDLHAEMVALNAFEETHGAMSDLGGHVLVTSVEPCPMCAARLILARVPKVLYVAADEGGGMARGLDRLPPSFRKLAELQVFAPADVSTALRKLASDLFIHNLEALRALLFKRLGPTGCGAHDLAT
ncbi:MAG: nucleoside deaminase [Verrucomicrobia bacterium]|nr:nucleoside deaminase [Verrucomicrobiota bacterium]